MDNVNSRDFKVLSDREHVLARPGMYLGAVSLTEKEQWIYSKEDGKFHFGKVHVVPALLKCASELIDNSIDVAIDTDFKFATKIKIAVDSKSIRVEDDGIGIPCVAPDGTKASDPTQTCACLAWTKLKAGTSFDDSRKKIGTNGVGASCCNVFSKLFVGISDDGKHRQKIECSDNMSIVKASKVSATSGKSGVTVYCEPDLARFGVSEIDQTHIDLIYQRLVNLAICYPKIKFTFNGERINVNEKKFAQMFSDNALIDSTSNTTVCVFPNEHDEFKFYACVNGIDTTRGGIHVDNITMEIANRIRDKLVKKYKSIRPGDIKSKLGIAVMLTSFVNPQFDSQTKESLANSNADILRHLDGKFDFDKFTKLILKNDAIIEPIVETFKIKEEFKARQELKRVKKVKVRSDKYMAPIGAKKYLALCEGASAMSGISSCLGRKEIGYYSMRGVPLNAYASTMQRIVANAELKDIINILDLDISKSEQQKTISFEKVLIATDADCFEKSTLVYAKDGLKEIKDINIGDEVLSSDGKLHEVVDVCMKKTSTLVIVTFCGSRIVVSPMQKMLVCRDGKLQEVHAKDLTVADKLLDAKSYSSRLDIACFKLLQIDSVDVTSCKEDEDLHDITVEGNHTFFIKPKGTSLKVLAHNCDGSHITSMLIGWFRKFAPNLFNEGKICKLLTPNVILEDSNGKIAKYFMNVAEFKAWEAANKSSKLKIVYLKGLGSWDRQQLIDLIDTNGLDKFIVEYKLDAAGDAYIEDWLGASPENRKKYLREYTFDIDQA